MQLGKNMLLNLTLLIVFLFVNTDALSLEHQDNTESGFIQTYWFEKGIEHGNPMFTNRIRVNSPEAVIGPFHDRVETRGNGMVQILVEQDLTEINGAQLYAEMWGGHPGTANKRVTLNGRSTYSLPDVAEDHHCTYTYPQIPLKITDLVNGYNAIQFACDQGDTFWGHFLLDNVAFLTFPMVDSLDQEELKVFSADVVVNNEVDSNEFQLSLNIDETYRDLISKVEYQAYYYGYDENGDGNFTDWHGFTKNRESVAWVGQSEIYPYQVDWNTQLIPEQENVAFRAVIHFKNKENLVYQTESVGPYSIVHPNSTVEMYTVDQLPKPFWSRDNNIKEAVITIDDDLGKVETAQLHVVIWDGGKGNTEKPFTLNGHALPVAGEGNHDLLYKVIDLDPEMLRTGENVIQLLSDTHHHGIEIIYPGPAIIVQYAEQ